MEKNLTFFKILEIVKKNIFMKNLKISKKKCIKMLKVIIFKILKYNNIV